MVMPLEVMVAPPETRPTSRSLPASPAPIERAPLVMRDCGDDDLVALNGIDQVVGKTAQHEFAKFIIHWTANARLRRNDGSHTVHLGNEGKAKAQRLGFVISGRLTKLDIRFVQKPDFHSRSANARRNTSSAGMAST